VFKNVYNTSVYYNAADANIINSTYYIHPEVYASSLHSVTATTNVTWEDYVWW